MRNQVMLITCVLIFAGVVTLHAQESHPMMTVAETVAWAKDESLKAAFADEPQTRPNPAAREQLWDVLADPEQLAAWSSVVYAFRFVGQSEDVPRIVRWVERVAAKPLTPSQDLDIQRVEAALAGMARRGVEGAGAALEKMMSPDYWHKLSADYALHTGSDPTNGMGYRLAAHATAEGIYSRDPDFKKKVTKIAEAITDPKERQAYTKEMENFFHDYDAHMADGLFLGQRLAKREADANSRSRAGEKPKKPSMFAYNEAFSRWTVEKADLAPAVRNRLVREAHEAFEAIAKDLGENKRAEVTARMCSQGIPCVLQDVDSSATAVEKIQDAKWWVYLDLEQAVVKSLASCHLNESAAIVKLSVLDKDKKGTVDSEKAAAEPEKHVDLIFVQIPYSDADGVKASDGLLLNPLIRFTESGPDGTVTLCMMKQAGHWYWMPFGE